MGRVPEAGKNKIYHGDTEAQRHTETKTHENKEGIEST